ncbi:MAG: PIG-L family deacetylase [Candidatus Thermofonsia Clade 1 bacterium]|jgi:LmbE family N-acetylglucosaminyl deacetylase|uniref:PIG-L family deacetylase n=1 Tax=Candidatus Thermofonsia Clade 1 bacterium TaxID=2364210 RepID=A0A2M8PD45_9CHLR|nr:MAG: PIG-L family deacetylase [Candidatus Thermofonsia Clade 1 bacterium]RMF50421.1 MAG: PIG-L family deacetylase [Chloroflexota bacterium]
MVIVAHPDDIEFSCAGTVARWVREGTQVCYVLCTSGDVGIAEPGMTKARAAEIREAEQRAAAAILGVQEVVFLREPDGMLEATLALRKKLVREIRRFKPDAVICGDPQVLWAGDGYINHPDHRAAALAALDAIFPAAGQPNLFEELAEEGLSAHKVYKVFVMTWERSDNLTYVDISSTIDLKIAALKAHKSQIGDWDPSESLKAWAAERARGLEFEYAETFRVITFEDAAPKAETAATQAAEGATPVPATGD